MCDMTQQVGNDKHGKLVTSYGEETAENSHTTHFNTWEAYSLHAQSVVLQLVDGHRGAWSKEEGEDFVIYSKSAPSEKHQDGRGSVRRRHRVESFSLIASEHHINHQIHRKRSSESNQYWQLPTRVVAPCVSECE